MKKIQNWLTTGTGIAKVRHHAFVKQCATTIVVVLPTYLIVPESLVTVGELYRKGRKMLLATISVQV